MRSSYTSLIRVRLRHTYFSDDQCVGCSVEPSTATRGMLQRLGLGFRAMPDGCVIFAEVEPGSAPPKLLRRIDDHPLRFVLLLEPQDTLLEQITSLPTHRPGISVFHLANLFDKQVDHRSLLTDLETHDTIGKPVELVTSPVYTYRVAHPQDGLELAATNMFGRQIAIPMPANVGQLSAIRIDFSRLEGFAPGFYKLADSAGNETRIYYDPSLAGKAPKVIVEIVSSTDELTENGQNLVPAAYRFVADGNVDPKVYFIQFATTETIWRYVVTKRDPYGLIEFNQLSVQGPVAFARVLDNGRAVFTSATAIRWAERPYPIELQHKGTRVQRLPNPSIGASLKKDDGAGIVSEVNVYV